MSGYKLPGKAPVAKNHNARHYSQLKLPHIDKKHSYQEGKYLSKIKSGKLTHLNTHFDHEKVALSQLYERCSSEMAAQLPNDIEQRINNILENHQIAKEYYNEDDQNFEANIQRNKEFLKIQREKRQSILFKSNDEIHSSLGQKGRTNKNSRPENINKKSMEKIKLIREHPSLKSKVQPLTIRQDSKIHPASLERGGKSSPGKQPVVNRLENKFKALRNNIAKRTKEKERKIYTEGQYEETSDNLFDNIHNYLSNPHHRSTHQNLITSSRSKIKNRKQVLEEQLRDIQYRLSTDNNVDRELRGQKEEQLLKVLKEQAKRGVDYGVTWRRVKFQQNDDALHKRISVDGSSFEREVSHLGNLQQRNEHSLQRYVQNQRLLQSLKLVKQNRSKQQLKREFLSK